MKYIMAVFIGLTLLLPVMGADPAVNPTLVAFAEARREMTVKAFADTRKELEKVIPKPIPELEKSYAKDYLAKGWKWNADEGYWYQPVAPVVPAMICGPEGCQPASNFQLPSFYRPSFQQPMQFSQPSFGLRSSGGGC